MANLWTILGTDRVLEPVTTPPGTGNVNLTGGSVPGFHPILAHVPSGSTFPYYLEAVDGQGLPTGEWERGIGRMQTDPFWHVNRLTVLGNAAGTTSPVNFTTACRIGIAPQTDMSPVQMVPGGRLCLNWADPTGDWPSGTYLYYVPYLHDQIQLHGGSGVRTIRFGVIGKSLAELSIAGNDLGFDVFARIVGGALDLTTTAWSDKYVRLAGNGLAWSNGFLCHEANDDLRYLGSVMTNATGSLADSPGGSASQVGSRRYVWNYYNRRPRAIRVHDSTANWTYTGAYWRPWNGVSYPANACEWFCGLAEDAFEVTQVSHTYLGAAYVAYLSGIGHNQYLTGPQQYYGRHNSAVAGETINATAIHAGRNTTGHNFAWNIEYALAGSPIAVGDGGAVSGMTGTVYA